MPGYILHLAEAEMIFQKLEERGYYLSPEWKNRFQLGCLLPDTKIKREKVTSHFWNPDDMKLQAIAPDMDRFYEKYGNCIFGPLMHGYRTHLMLDALFVNEFWDKILEFQDENGRRAELAAEIHSVVLKNTGETVLKEKFFTKDYYYGDYSRMNEPLQRKYKIPVPQYEEGLPCLIEEVGTEDLKRVLNELNTILKNGSKAAKEPLRVFRQEQLEEFIRSSAEEAVSYIQNHLYMLAFDLDGTLLKTDKSLSKKSRRVIEQAISDGHQVVIASGRPFSALPDNVLSIPGIIYAIASNGVSIYDLRNSSKIFHNPMEASAAEAVLALAAERGGTLEVLYDGQAYTSEEFIRDPMKYGVDAHGVAYIQATRKAVEDIGIFAKAHIHELDAIDLMTPDLEERNIYMERLGKIPQLYVTSSIPTLIEISAEGAGKGKALSKLSDRMGHPIEQIIAFGNEENDLEMLETAGCGVAVANSPDSVKNRADQVAGTNDEDGVALFIEKILFNKKPGDYR